MLIDYEKNRDYYKKYIPCNCELCNNYYRNVVKKHPEIKEYLESMGIDILKPFELIPFALEEDKKIEYLGCQYVVFGECDDSFKKEIEGISFFKNMNTHPSDAEIAQRHFIIDFGPIVLEWK